MTRKMKVNILILFIFLCIIFLIFYYITHQPPEYVITRNAKTGLYRTKYLGNNEGPFMEIPPNTKLKLLEYHIKFGEVDWTGPVKVEYNGKTGWIYFRDLSDKSKEELKKAASF